jgi:hypothetical protein
MGKDVATDTYKWIIGDSSGKVDWNITSANTLTITGTVSGSTITGGTIQTATSGQRIRIISASGTTPTQTANSFGLIDTNNNLLASIGSDSDYIVKVSVPSSPTGASYGMYVSNSEGTTTRTAYFGRTSTGATGQNVLMESSSTGTNLKIDCINTSSTGIGCHIDYDALGNAFEIDVTTTTATGYAEYINNAGQGYSLYVAHHPPTSTGAYLAYLVNQADIAIETVRVNAANSGNTAAPLYLQTGGALATNFKKLIRGNTHTIWESDGTTPNGNLDTVQGVVAGDICIGADSGQTYYCTNAAEPGAWTAM